MPARPHTPQAPAAPRARSAPSVQPRMAKTPRLLVALRASARAKKGSWEKIDERMRQLPPKTRKAGIIKKTATQYLIDARLFKLLQQYLTEQRIEYALYYFRPSDKKILKVSNWCEPMTDAGDEILRAIWFGELNSFILEKFGR